MTNTLKTFFSIIAILGLLAGCSSNSEKETAAAAEPTPAPDTADEAPVSTVDEVVDAATVFYFDFDQSILRSDARAALMIHAENLKASPRSIRLEGHADERGSREYNMALGERRANAVRDFLILQGVDSYLIETVSYGEERPASVGSYESAWSENRRVELK